MDVQYLLVDRVELPEGSPPIEGSADISIIVYIVLAVLICLFLGLLFKIMKFMIYYRTRIHFQIIDSEVPTPLIPSPSRVEMKTKVENKELYDECRRPPLENPAPVKSNELSRRQIKNRRKKNNKKRSSLCNIKSTDKNISSSTNSSTPSSESSVSVPDNKLVNHIPSVSTNFYSGSSKSNYSSSSSNQVSSEDGLSATPVSTAPSSPQIKKNTKRVHRNKQYQKLPISDSSIYLKLQSYVLNHEDRLKLDYPTEIPSRTPDRRHSTEESSVSTSNLNILAKEFVPTLGSRKGVNCCRCQANFVPEEEYGSKVTKGCSYHYGKFLDRERYACCGNVAYSPGCTRAPYHVWMGDKNPVGEFQKAKFGNGVVDRIYALDCEMVFTAGGFSVAKVVIISMTGDKVYDSYVLPKEKIVDYNTRFSGISEELFESCDKKSFEVVQKEILDLITHKSIIIGHGLENDLRVLKLIHYNVIDTSVLFPHYYGLPYKRSLKNLAKSYLKKTIQDSDSTGHDPYEDALASAALVLWKLRQDLEMNNTSSPLPVIDSYP